MATKGIILSAAKADITICDVFGYVPTGLIPVNGKPIIYYIIKQFHDSAINDIIIGVDYKSKKLKAIVDLYFAGKVNIKYIKTDKNKKPGDSLLKIIKKIGNGAIVVNLADTYIKGLDLSTIKNTLVVSDNFNDGRRWSSLSLDKSKNIIEFYDKKKLTENQLVLTGVYGFKDISIFNQFDCSKQELEITDLCNFYINSGMDLVARKTEDWMDFGHIDRYQFSKKRLIQSREFNYLEFDDFFGTISKKSKNPEKLRNEINWYLKLPDKIKIISPRVIDYSLDPDPYIISEYYSYPPLSEIWLYSELSKEIFKSVIDKLFKVLDFFQNYSKNLSIQNYESIYIEKTKSRVKEIKNPKLLRLMESHHITINGVRYKNWNQLESKVFDFVIKFYNINHNCLIHGDFCFSNILYDIRSGIFKIIDPRGSWGESTYGDIKYDFAKLRHSIAGGYDYISNDLFSLAIDKDFTKIDYSIHQLNKTEIIEYFDKKIEGKFDISHIKLIEGLLFLSMIPLHNESSNRQVVFYARSIELLNQIVM
tara:strand:+ start:401 stop:2005 length:1605 start_codon:yes stop_codon:yes gene_type:complete